MLKKYLRNIADHLQASANKMPKFTVAKKKRGLRWDGAKKRAAP